MTNFLKKNLSIVLAAIVLISGSALQAQGFDEGMAAMQLKEWDKAIEHYTALTKKDPADQVAWLTLGSAYLMKGEKGKAKQMFEAAFNAKSEGPYAQIASARIILLEQPENYQEKAEDAFKKAKKWGKKDIVTKRLIGESYLYKYYPEGVRPDYSKAEEELKEAMDYDSKDFPTVMALAFCYKEKPDGGLAAQHYELALHLEPNNALAQFMLAKVYRFAKIYDKFLINVDKAVALKPDFTQALRSKAEFLYFEKKWEEATKAAKNLINNGKEVTIEDEMMLANLLFFTKDCAGCSALVDKILKKDGSKNYLRRLQAYCNYDNGKYPEGLKILNDFFKQVTPDKIVPSDYEYLAKLQLASGGDTVAAIGNFNKVMEMDSSKWPLHEDIAKLYYSSKDYCNAAIAYQKYIDSLEDVQALVNASFYLGLSHYYCFDDSLHYQKAEKAFAKITEIVPDAGIGWAWRAKAMSKLEPDIENNPELLEEFGKAKPFYEEFVKIGEQDTEKNKKDLITSYEYLASYYFLKEDDENARANLEKLFALDPENSTGLDIQKFLDGETPAPTPVNGGKK